MHHRLDAALQRQLDALQTQSMRRRLRPLPHSGRHITCHNQSLINLAGNDYLALSQHPHLKQAACDAIAIHGTGAGASRLVVGHFDLHDQIEQQCAAFKHAQAALLMPTGYMANLALLTTLPGKGDLICLDKLNHASLIDAARASDAIARSYPHLQTDKLKRLLEQHQKASPDHHRFVVTDAVFSMDGDCANLPALADLCQQYDAHLIVDEAHSTGLFGAQGSGLCEAVGITDRVTAVVSTASKALGGLGGIITGSQPIIDTLINRARPLIYTTAIPAHQAAGIGAALDVIRDEPSRREHLAQLCTRLEDDLRQAGWALPARSHPTPIFPLIVGSAPQALALAKHLQHQGLLAIAIRPPTVSPGKSRVRVSLRADLDHADLDRLLDALRSADACP